MIINKNQPLSRFEESGGGSGSGPGSGTGKTESPGGLEPAQASPDHSGSSELLELFGKQSSVPLDSKRLPGWLQDYLMITTRYTDARPGLLLTAFLPFCAVNLGNRVFMTNNGLPIYPNIWSCLIGRSSISRKTTALRFAERSIREYEESLENGPLAEYERKTLVMNGITVAKLFRYLAENPCRLFLHQELAAWLGEMNKHYNQNYRHEVTKLFDGVNTTFTNLERTDRVRKPALSVAGATTEGWLYKNLRDGPDQLSGFLQRMIYYVVKNISLDEIDLIYRDDGDLDDGLAFFENNLFRFWRDIPGCFQLRLSDQAREFRNAEYEKIYHHYFKKDNEALMSYFSRIYDGYWFKFCILFTLMWKSEEFSTALSRGNCADFFARERVELSAATQAMYLCGFYMENTRPFLAIMEEEDKLAGERRLLDLLINKYGGSAGHTQLMNGAHMKKREFMDIIENLIERGAVRVETQKTRNHPSAKLYVVAPVLMESFSTFRSEE
ncbi:MAG: DUF3987 domain-containing protein [Candidatus Syntrophosphaera sp.]|nr:DUF3987 domain-containing protein [Candidatus Syntrophosphaera sp.]